MWATAFCSAWTRKKTSGGKLPSQNTGSVRVLSRAPFHVFVVFRGCLQREQEAALHPVFGYPGAGLGGEHCFRCCFPSHVRGAHCKLVVACLRISTRTAWLSSRTWSGPASRASLSGRRRFVLDPLTCVKCELRHSCFSWRLLQVIERYVNGVPENNNVNKVSVIFCHTNDK